MAMREETLSMHMSFTWIRCDVKKAGRNVMAEIVGIARKIRCS